jgi:ABC-type transport system substrate-binding protein
MTGDYDMLIFDRGFSLDPQGAVADAYTSTNVPSADNPNGGNIFRWNNPAADEAIATAGGTFDQAVRQGAYCDLGKLIQEDAIEDHIYLFQDGYGFSSKLTGYTVSTWGSMTWDVQNWQYK